jgi:hypothetical protein
MAKEAKSKTVVKVALAFQVDAPDGIKGMAAIDAKLESGVEELAKHLGIKAEDIARTDRPQRVLIA